MTLTTVQLYIIAGKFPARSMSMNKFFIILVILCALFILFNVMYHKSVMIGLVLLFNACDAIGTSV